ncbi:MULTISPECIES: hypothetical protein [unclassified Streptomyces]|uniref:hypothetical protein n=1 Tax=Streptomyces sp. NPDC127532 TaxID=3345399 RepID=UPI00362700DB
MGTLPPWNDRRVVAAFRADHKVRWFGTKTEPLVLAPPAGLVNEEKRDTAGQSRPSRAAISTVVP